MTRYGWQKIATNILKPSFIFISREIYVHFDLKSGKSLKKFLETSGGPYLGLDLETRLKNLNPTCHIFKIAFSGCILQVREFSDDGLVIKMTCEGVTATQKYKRE